jgi:hypothetical protein
VAKRLLFDVFGQRMVVEPSPAGWKLFRLGPDGKCAPVDARSRRSSGSDELLQYPTTLSRARHARESVREAWRMLMAQTSIILF